MQLFYFYSLLIAVVAAVSVTCQNLVPLQLKEWSEEP